MLRRDHSRPSDSLLKEGFSVTVVAKDRFPMVAAIKET
jgi:hypothetical protein